MDAVLDTSVLVRGLTTGPKTVVGFIMDCWERRLFRVVLSEYILDELEHALTQPYFQSRSSPELLAQYISRVTQDAVVIPITAQVHGVAPSPGDDMVLATAMSAYVPYVVTGDRRFQEIGEYQGVRTVDPGTFAGILRSLPGE